MTARLTWRARVRTAATVPLAALLLAAVPAQVSFAEDSTSGSDSSTSSESGETGGAATPGQMMDKSKKKGTGGGTKRPKSESVKKKFDKKKQEKAADYWTDGRIKSTKPFVEPEDSSRKTKFVNKGRSKGTNGDELGEGLSDLSESSDDLDTSKRAFVYGSYATRTDNENLKPTSRVGMLFFSYKDKKGETVDASCSAAVVASKTGKTISTAGHCVVPTGDAAENFLFIPEIHFDESGNKLSPLGRYAAGNFMVNEFFEYSQAALWGNPSKLTDLHRGALNNTDVAFLSVDPIDAKGNVHRGGDFKDQVAAYAGSTSMIFNAFTEDELYSDNPPKTGSFGYPGNIPTTLQTRGPAPVWLFTSPDGSKYLAWDQATQELGSGGSGGPVMLDGNIEGFQVSVYGGVSSNGGVYGASLDSNAFALYTGAGGFTKDMVHTEDIED